jgi:transcriptional regulator with XRE-family HTH domain
MEHDTTNSTELRLIRTTLGVTQADLGTLLGITEARVRQYETGTRPMPEPLLRLAREFVRPDARLERALARIKAAYRT